MEKLNNSQKYLLMTELETIIDSGMGFEEGLYLLSENMEGKLKDVCIMLKDHYMESHVFSMALKECGCFDDYSLKIIEIGEINGSIHEVLKKLSRFYLKQGLLEEKISEAVSQPLILLTVTELIMGVIIFKVYPVFEDILLKMGISSLTKALRGIEISRLIAIFLFVICGFILLLSFIYLLRLKKGNMSISKLLKILPFKRNIYDSLMLERLSYGLSLFSISGYSLEDASKYLPDLVEDDVLKNKFKKIAEDTDKGISFIESLCNSDIYSGNSLSILKIGLKSGHQEDTFAKLEDIYERKSDELISKLLGRIEPVLIAVLSIVVGMIVLSVMMPLLDITGLI